jgi:putative SOS response-associated peptidase YedK
MCGRFTLYHDEEDLTGLLDVATFPLTARYNIAPTQPVTWVRQLADGSREALTGRWGLIPAWAPDPRAFKANLINARSETAASKPSFRDAFRRGRCVVPASGFFEWRRTGARKQPYHVVRDDGAPLLLAGLYAERPAAEGGPSVAIMTCAANERIAAIHDRMPVVLAPGELGRWLDTGRQRPADVDDLLVPCPNDWLRAYPVDPRVGNPRADDPLLVEPRDDRA